MTRQRSSLWISTSLYLIGFCVAGLLRVGHGEQLAIYTENGGPITLDQDPTAVGGGNEAKQPEKSGPEKLPAPEAVHDAAQIQQQQPQPVDDVLSIIGRLRPPVPAGFEVADPLVPAVHQVPVPAAPKQELKNQDNIDEENLARLLQAEIAQEQQAQAAKPVAETVKSVKAAQVDVDAQDLEALERQLVEEQQQEQKQQQQVPEPQETIPERPVRFGQKEVPFPPAIPIPHALKAPAPQALYRAEDKRRAEGAVKSQDDAGDTIFIAVTAVCSAAAIFGVVAAGMFWYRLNRQYKAAQESEYPHYGITGPTKERTSGANSPTATIDAKLAGQAQLYHYQHTKQQIIQMEQSQHEGKGRDSDESDNEGDEGDFSVYECPGLAPTGDIEISNPLFESMGSPHVKNFPMSPATGGASEPKNIP